MMKTATGASTRNSSISIFLLVSIPILVLPWGRAAGDPSPTEPQSLALVYDAAYMGYKFAEIDFSESNPYVLDGDTVRNLECDVKSSGILTIDGHYRSVVRDDFTVLYFKSDEGSPENRKIAEYWFDYGEKRIKRIRTGIRDTDTTRSDIEFTDVDGRYFDSISLIFRIRDGLDTLNTPAYLPIFDQSGADSILIEDISNVEETGPDGSSIPVMKIKGKIPFETYPGFGDDFEIYITSDSTRIPVRGRIEMALGYIDIRLREWK